MAVLVTGGAGYIGSHMVWALVDAGETAVVLDDLSTGRRQSVPHGVTFIQGDVGDGELVGRIIRDSDIQAVIHFAGSIIVPESVARPLDYYHNNTVKSRALIAAAVDAGVRHFIFSSTAAVYGMPDTMPVAEDAPLRPLSPYGTSKMMTEIMLRDASAAHDFRAVSLRYFNVAGADPLRRAGQSTQNATHLIKVACEAALNKRPFMDVYGTDYATPDGTGIRDYIHVSDLAQAHLDALNYLRAGGATDVFNCGYSRGHSVLQVIDAVKRLSGRDFAVRMMPRRAGDAPAIIAATDKIRSALGWRPRYDSLDQIIADAWAWENRA